MQATRHKQTTIEPERISDAEELRLQSRMRPRAVRTLPRFRVIGDSTCGLPPLSVSHIRPLNAKRDLLSLAVG